MSDRNPKRNLILSLSRIPAMKRMLLTFIQIGGKRENKLFIKFSEAGISLNLPGNYVDEKGRVRIKTPYQLAVEVNNQVIIEHMEQQNYGPDLELLQRVARDNDLPNLKKWLRNTALIDLLTPLDSCGFVREDRSDWLPFEIALETNNIEMLYELERNTSHIGEGHTSRERLIRVLLDYRYENAKKDEYLELISRLPRTRFEDYISSPERKLFYDALAKEDFYFATCFVKCNFQLREEVWGNQFIEPLSDGYIYPLIIPEAVNVAYEIYSMIIRDIMRRKFISVEATHALKILFDPHEDLPRKKRDANIHINSISFWTHRYVFQQIARILGRKDLVEFLSSGFLGFIDEMRSRGFAREFMATLLERVEDLFKEANIIQDKPFQQVKRKEDKPSIIPQPERKVVKEELHRIKCVDCSDFSPPGLGTKSHKQSNPSNSEKISSNQLNDPNHSNHQLMPQKQNIPRQNVPSVQQSVSTLTSSKLNAPLSSTSLASSPLSSMSLSSPSLSSMSLSSSPLSSMSLSSSSLMPSQVSEEQRIVLKINKQSYIISGWIILH